MKNQYLDNLLENKEVRQSLIEIKRQLKQDALYDPVCAALNGHMDKLAELLMHEDAKVRKNTAQILGEIGAQNMLDALVAAYEGETTLFVRPALIEAIGQMDYRRVLPVLEKRLDVLNHMEMTSENKKHLTRELHILTELVVLATDAGRPAYTQKGVPTKVILTTRKGREAILADELRETLPELTSRTVAGGVMVSSVKHPDVLFRLRTWQNMLFVFCKENGFEKNAQAIGEGIVRADLPEYLRQRHDGGSSWRFRVDVHTKDEPKKKAMLAKQTASAIEVAYGGRMVNSVSDYDLEIVLMEGKDQKVFVWLKLHTLEDRRFAYRKNFVAASMNPVNAAQMIYAARDYFKDNANILDPFCGVGTLLIERRLWAGKKRKIRGLYGVDTFGQAIDGGRENAGIIGCPINFIQRDFFDFSHGYLFDEVITDMPEHFDSEQKTAAFYRRFFEKIQSLLADDARLFIYSTQAACIRSALKEYPQFRWAKTVVFSAKTNASLFILIFQKNYK